MQIKKFQAKTEAEAMQQVKEELGKDAVVMNVRTIKPKGIYRLFKKSMIEVTAAIEDNRSYNSGEEMLAKLQEIQNSNEKETVAKTSEKENLNRKDKTPEENGNKQIEDKLNSLQELLEKQMQLKLEEEKAQHQEEKMLEEKSEPEDTNQNDACIQLIYSQLVANEVDSKFAETIINEIKNNLSKDAALDNVLASIYQKIILKLGQPKTIQIGETEPKFIFFVGPTGVGKTTTIAKIASELKVQKKNKIALITSDTYRIAAVEQLRTYANILGVPLKVVYSEEEMKTAREEFGEYDLVLVDTAGRSHKSREQKDDLERLLRAIPKEERDTYLVLSATTKYRDLLSIADVYSDITKYNIVFTKLDETSCIGNILNIRMHTGAELSYATSGQNVPEDIEIINPQNIAKQLLGGQ